MPVAAAVLVRNRMAGPTVLASDPKGTEQVEWGGAGDPSGSDYQYVSDTLASSVAFIRNVQKGVLEVVADDATSDPEVIQAIERQAKAWTERQGRSAAVASEAIERTENNDFISVPCIGPNPKGGQCGADVAVKASKKNDAAPLCATHESLRHEYVPEVHIEGEENVTVWMRATLGARQREID